MLDPSQHVDANAKKELAFLKHALNEHAIVSTANTRGDITYINDKFCAISGYTREELLGSNHNIIKSDEHSKDFFKAMWKVISSGKTWHGEIKNTRKSGGHYWVKTTIVPTLDSKGKPYQYVAIRTEITEQKNVEEKLNRIAYHDLLTDLPNSVRLSEYLSQAIMKGQLSNKSVAVARLDLDGFKSVNDIFGHLAGDELLVAMSKHMQSALREGDMLSRIGGDEFIAIIVDLKNSRDSKPVLERLLQATNKPIILNGIEIRLSSSIGVTHYPLDGSTAEQLIRRADHAMYQAKQAGKNRYYLFDIAQDQALHIQRQRIADVRLALQRREFVLHYQPKVNMRTGQVIGLEALIRWQHPVQGMVPPLEFLPAIEGHSISLELGEWVINAALCQIKQWQDRDLNIPISVNISAYQLTQIDFSERLAILLNANPEVNPSKLELEILETTALSDMAQVSATMHKCHKLGVCFSLDDFGTGYSSLTYLRRLPAHLIKIDQSFVRDMLEDTDDLAIVAGVIGLAKSFHREVIAEGVETIAHGAELLRLGCDLAQGYGIARPMPASDIAQWISTWTPDPSWLGTDKVI